ncbi:MAG: hypothetical protein JRN67_12000 [Nitrososphaerota archaeon]|nr:hypothetical protein [Nitrososphaerota archaeon]
MIIDNSVKDRSINLGTGQWIRTTATNEDHGILRYLNLIASEENNYFVKIVKSRGLLIFNQQEYLGYLSWLERSGDIPLVGQICIIDGARRMKHGTKLISHFVSSVANKPNDEGYLFCIDSPKDSILWLLDRLNLTSKYSVTY